jgi:hypothetical protein
MMFFGIFRNIVDVYYYIFFAFFSFSFLYPEPQPNRRTRTTIRTTPTITTTRSASAATARTRITQQQQHNQFFNVTLLNHDRRIDESSRLVVENRTDIGNLKTTTEELRKDLRLLQLIVVLSVVGFLFSVFINFLFLVKK